MSAQSGWRLTGKVTAIERVPKAASESATAARADETAATTAGTAAAAAATTIANHWTRLSLSPCPRPHTIAGFSPAVWYTGTTADELAVR